MSDSALQLSITLLLNTYFFKSNLLHFYIVSMNDLFFDLQSTTASILTTTTTTRMSSLC